MMNMQLVCSYHQSHLLRLSVLHNQCGFSLVVCWAAVNTVIAANTVVAEVHLNFLLENRHGVGACFANLMPRSRARALLDDFQSAKDVVLSL